MNSSNVSSQESSMQKLCLGRINQQLSRLKCKLWHLVSILQLGGHTKVCLCTKSINLPSRMDGQVSLNTQGFSLPLCCSVTQEMSPSDFTANRGLFFPPIAGHMYGTEKALPCVHRGEFQPMTLDPGIDNYKAFPWVYVSHSNY